MNRAIETGVLIVGAGPVGLTLAIDLARRGVDVTVAEIRRSGELPSVKCNQVSARSMEIFRRLGVAGKVREVGLPPDYPNDVVSCTTVTGIELLRIPIPSRAERFSAVGGPDTAANSKTACGLRMRLKITTAPRPSRLAPAARGRLHRACPWPARAAQ